MNFFANQERARSQIKKLVFLYGLTVLFVGVATGFIVALVYFNSDSSVDWAESTALQSLLQDALFQQVWLSSTAIVSVVILAISGIKIMMLGTPGPTIAKMVGAIPLEEIEETLAIKQYKNVVEEMALASGTPVPKLYLMDQDQSINAFVAGTDINSSVLAVTKGCLEKLNRHELQGVIAHEYSHLFNGDMLLNVRLMGLLGGLTSIFHLGRILLHSGSSARRVRSSNNKKGDGNALALVGIGLCLVGGLGVFLASLLKSRISQKKEYLADASSVQYTRNPEGILGALKKIFADSQRGQIQATKSSEVAHFFLVDPVVSHFMQLATHPPLQKRLKAIDPRFNEKDFLTNEIPKLKKEMIELQGELSQTNRSHRPAMSSFADQGISQLSMAVPLAAKLTKSERPEWVKAKAAALLLWEDNSLDQGLKFIEKNESKQFLESVVRLRQEIKAKKRELIDELDVLAPDLFSIGREDGKSIINFLHELRKADGKTSLNEYLITRFCHEVVRKESAFVAKKLKLKQVESEIGIILSLLAQICPSQKDDGEVCFRQALEKKSSLLAGAKLQFAPKITYANLDSSFDRLRFLAPLEKEKFLQLAIEVVKYDNQVSSVEKTWLKLLGQVLAVPSKEIEMMW